MAGLRPVVELMFVDFFGVAADQIFNQMAKLRYMFGGKASVPLVLRTTIGGGVGAAAQHSGCPYSTFTHFPGLKTVVPATPADAKGLLIAAIRDDDPVVFFEHKGLYGTRGPVPVVSDPVPLGRADVKRVGDDVTIVAVAKMVGESLAAAEDLASDGVSAEVVDLRTLSPLDVDTILGSVSKTGRLVIVDEDNPRCSIASDVAALAAQHAFKRLKAPVAMVTSPHTPVPFTPQPRE